MFCKLDDRRKSIVSLALSLDNRKIVVRYFVNRDPDRLLPGCSAATVVESSFEHRRRCTKLRNVRKSELLRATLLCRRAADEPCGVIYARLSSLPHDAMRHSALCAAILRPPVCPSHAGIVAKQMNIHVSSRNQRHSVDTQQKRLEGTFFCAGTTVTPVFK